jgi:hypothetical protein
MFAKLKAKFTALRENLKGYKTIVWNVFLALSVPVAVALQQLGAIDWSQYVGPFGAIGIGFLISGVGIGLRYLTTGPVGSKGDEAPPADVKAGD